MLPRAARGLIRPHVRARMRVRRASGRPAAVFGGRRRGVVVLLPEDEEPEEEGAEAFMEQLKRAAASGADDASIEPRDQAGGEAGVQELLRQASSALRSASGSDGAAATGPADRAAMGDAFSLMERVLEDAQQQGAAEAGVSEEGLAALRKALSQRPDQPQLRPSPLLSEAESQDAVWIASQGPLAREWLREEEGWAEQVVDAGGGGSCAVVDFGAARKDEIGPDADLLAAEIPEPEPVSWPDTWREQPLLAAYVAAHCPAVADRMGAQGVAQVPAWAAKAVASLPAPLAAAGTHRVSREDEEEPTDEFDDRGVPAHTVEATEYEYDDEEQQAAEDAAAGADPSGTVFGQALTVHTRRLRLIGGDGEGEGSDEEEEEGEEEEVDPGAALGAFPPCLEQRAVLDMLAGHLEEVGPDYGADLAGSSSARWGEQPLPGEDEAHRTRQRLAVALAAGQVVQGWSEVDEESAAQLAVLYRRLDLGGEDAV